MRPEIRQTPRSAGPNRLAVALFACVIGMALGLGGCGRKGPLDPPPGAAAAPAPAASSSSSGAVPRVFGGSSEKPRAETSGQQRRIPLDVLLE